MCVQQTVCPGGAKNDVHCQRFWAMKLKFNKISQGKRSLVVCADFHSTHKTKYDMLPCKIVERDW